MKDYPVLFSVEDIDDAVSKMASEINQSCEGEWLVMSVLTGGLVLTADLIRKLTIPVVLESLKVTRYHNTTKGKNLDWHLTPKSSLSGCQILLVDDIFDEGQTLQALHTYCLGEGASEVKSAVLLDKQHDRRSVTYVPDFIGLQCPDRYVFGYGMDMEGRLRQLPAIHALPLT